MQKNYEAFLQRPTAARYLELRAELLREWGAPKMPAIQVLQREVRQGNDSASIKKRIHRLSGHWLLSPRFHLLVADFSQQRDDVEQFELSLFESECCLEAILATGDGSDDRPFVSMYPSDVGDVACALGVRVSSQHLIQREPQWFDIATCDDRELWFTRPMAAVEVSAGL